MTQVERSEAAKLAQSVLQGLEALDVWQYCEPADCGDVPDPYLCFECGAGRGHEHYDDCLYDAALTSARALLSLLEKEAGSGREDVERCSSGGPKKRCDRPATNAYFGARSWSADQRYPRCDKHPLPGARRVEPLPPAPPALSPDPPYDQPPT